MFQQIVEAQVMLGGQWTENGGSYALASARALLENTDLSAREIAVKSLKIAGQICIYTNDQMTIEELKAEPANQ